MKEKDFSGFLPIGQPFSALGSDTQDSVQFDFSPLYVYCAFSATAEAHNWIRSCSFALLLASVLSLSTRCLLSFSITNYATVCSFQEPG